MSKVKEFIANKQSEAIEAKKETLRKLGLVEDETKRIYYPTQHKPTTEFDYEKKMYYEDINEALEVTDEEYALICELCKDDIKRIESESLHTQYNNIEEDENSPTKVVYSEAKTLRLIAIIILCLGVGIVLIFSILALTSESWEVFGIGFSALFTSIATWAVFNVISNISTSIQSK